MHYVLNWLKEIWKKPWVYHGSGCGCAYIDRTFGPVEFKNCEKHAKEIRDYVASLPKEDNDDNYCAPFIT